MNRALIFSAMAALQMLTASGLRAEQSLSDLVVNGLRQAIQRSAPTDKREQARVLAPAIALLGKHTTVRSDGIATTIYRPSASRQHVELKGLQIRQITPVPLSDADRLNGIARRFHVHLACDAHRVWMASANEWSDWRISTYILFPKTVVVEEINHSLVASSNSLKWFVPGPGQSVIKPTSPDDSLPPGVVPVR